MVAGLLGATAVALTLASIAGQLMTYLAGHDKVFGLVSLFNTGAEKNAPTAFSTLLLLVAAFLLAYVVVIERKRDRITALYWALLSIGFLLMAVDEWFSFHEELHEPMRALLGTDTYGIFYYSWVVVGIGLVLVLALLFAGFLPRLPSKTRNTLLFAWVSLCRRCYWSISQTVAMRCS